MAQKNKILLMERPKILSIIKKRHSIIRFCVIVVGALLGTSCRDQQDIHQTFRIAGKNRAELIKVLDYYEMKGNEEELFAADYLIRSLSWHSSYCGDINHYREMMDTLIPLMTSAKRYNQYMGIITDSLKNHFVLMNDAEVVSSDFLINNIDEAFNLWKTGRWARHLSIEEFCEYLLPYKVAEHQPLEEWRNEYNGLFRGSEETVDKAIDEYRGEPHIALQNIRGAAIGHVLSYSDSLETTSLYDIRLLKDLPYGDCVSLCDLGLLLYRSKGIPVAMDFVPGWADRAGSHAWLSVYTRRGISRPVHAFSNGDPVDEVQCRRFAKVYRRTYKPNEELAHRIKRGYPVPARLSNICFEDVTEEYVKCEDVVLNANRRAIGRNVYAAVFDNRQWLPVAYGHRTVFGKLTFEKLARNALYLPVVIQKSGAQIPVGPPFFIHTDGAVESIPTNQNGGKCNAITISRKYPVYWLLAAVYERTRGGQIQGSNRVDFQDAVTIVEFSDTNSWSGHIPVNTKSPYRYYRFRASKGKSCDIAELKFYEGNTCLKPETALLAPGLDGNPNVVFDDNALTWISTDDSQESWVGMDYGSPVKITSFYYAVRSDGNDFYPGYEYALLSWNGTAWEKLESFLGTREVYHSFIDLPEGPLYMVTCQTTGTQSRPFLTKDGTVHWL